MDTVEVEILHTSAVKPASSSPQPSLYLPSLDLLLRDLSYNRRVLFYDRPASPSGDDHYALFVGTLRTSLSQALAHFYPLAGRLAVGSNGRLTIACNDEGAEFVEARVHGASFSALRSCNFDMHPYFHHLTRWGSYSSQLHEGFAPILSVQVTRFACGSIALGIAHSHVCADGHSLWHFMSAWAECARKEPISLFPSHDRTLLKIENPSKEMASFDHPSLEDAIVNHKDQGKSQKAFCFTKEMVETLKKRANNEFSSYEVLCAHMWKKVSNARGLARDVKVAFDNVVNMRARMKPALSPSYFGNVIHYGMAIASVGELQDEDLAATAARIRAAVKLCSNESVRRLQHFIEVYGSKKSLSKILLNGVRMRVSSSPKFPMLSCNFGWGKPLAVRSAIVEEKGKVIFYTGREGLGSADFCIALPSYAMQRLENDPSFLVNL